MMNRVEFRPFSEFLQAYNNGQRIFVDWDFEEDGSAQGVDLSGVEFRNCFLFLDFRKTNLTHSKFIDCNIKTADFRGANLSNGLIKGCCVESTLFSGANVGNFQFEDNFCFGAIVGATDFEANFKDSDSY